MRDTGLARHDLVWLKPAAGALARPFDNCGNDGIAPDERNRILAGWLDAARPLVTARQATDVPPEHVRLGLPLPPADGKHRFAFDIPVSAIDVSTPPPLLCDIADRLSADWQAKIEHMLADPAIAATHPRVFGSAAMQVLTGLPYLTASSDIDLILEPHDWPAAAAAIAALAELDAFAPTPRIDGEIVDPRGRAASWRELSSRPGRLMMKSMNDVSLVTLQTYIDGFGRAAAEEHA